MFFIFNFFFNYDLFFVDSSILSTYTDKIWLTYSNLISLFLIILFVILLGIVLANNAKHVKFLNLTSAFYLTIFFFFNSLNYSYDFLNLNLSFNQNTSLFVNFFIFISTITAILFFLGISNIFYIEENSKIEFSFLIWFIYLSAIYLISSTDFISIIILLECIAFSSYVLVGFERKNKFSTTSALKYLILASIPSGFFILGIALLYNNFGTFSQDYLNILLQKLLDINAISNFPEERLFIKALDEHYLWLYDRLASEILVKNNFSSLEETILTELQLYFSYVNDVFELWSPDIAKTMVSLLTSLSDQVEYPADSTKTFANELSIIIAKNPILLENKALYENYLNQLDLLTNHLVIETNLHLFICFATFYPYVIQELHFLQFFWQNFFLDNSSIDSLTNLPNWNTLFIYLRENNFLNILTWFQFFAKEEFNHCVSKEITKSFLIEGPKPITDFLEECGAWTFNDFNKNINFEKNRVFNKHDFIEISITSLDILDMLHSKLILLLNAYKYNIARLEIFPGGCIQGYEVQFIRNIFRYFDMLENYNLGAINFIESNTWEMLNFKELYLNHKHFAKNALETYDFFIKENLSYIIQLLHSSTGTFLTTYLVIIFILTNICFKLTAAPFHVWAPSVYGGSPLATLTFLSIFSKLTIIFFTIWLFLNTFDSLKNIWQSVILLISFLSVICSVLGAFSEKIFKRFFVYSSIGHVGFMLIGIAVLNLDGIKGALDYLILYIISSFLIWFILLHLSKKTTMLVNLKGLSFNQPMLSLIFSITIFSLSGIPPFGGFFVKYEIFYSMINSSLFYFAYILLILTVVSFFYYLRLIKIIFFEQNKLFIKNKNIDDIKLRIVAFCFFIIPFFMLFIENPLSYFLKEILYKSLF